MANEEDQVANGPSSMGLIDSLEKRYHKIKEHAETYPYVWASYIVVYGGFALWTTYRWRKLRKTEDRVRVLLEQMRKNHEAEEFANTNKVIGKGSASSEKYSKESANSTKVVGKGSASSEKHSKDSANSTKVVGKGSASSEKHSKESTNSTKVVEKGSSSS